MPSITAHTRLSGTKPNEDWYAATDNLIVVLDGATIRTDTGCVHGLPWYVHQLGSALLTAAQDYDTSLPIAIAQAIERVAEFHRSTCDLHHPGTPSAAIGIARRNDERWEWASLGDVSVIVQTPDGVQVTSDNRVSQIAVPERRECDRYLLGTQEKLDAIHAMKPVELANRNVAGGYWIASVLPEAAEHAYTSSAEADDVARLAVCSDGAMRALDLTSINTPGAVLEVLRATGPETLVDQVRAAEMADSLGRRVPRNKAYDDATAVFLEQAPKPAPATPSEQERQDAIRDVTDRMSSSGLFGATPVVDGRVL